MNPALLLAGRRVPGAGDRVRRYCGLSWSGGAPETWAFRYYDVVPFEGPGVDPVDVLAAAALHPGLSRADLAFFHAASEAVDSWLRATPGDVSLAEASDDVLAHLSELATWPNAPTLTLLSKVLHRARPHLIPLVDRHVIDAYRPLTGERQARGAWPKLLPHLAGDAAANAAAIAVIADDVEAGTGTRPSALRVMDIAIWMGATR